MGYTCIAFLSPYFGDVGIINFTDDKIINFADSPIIKIWLAFRKKSVAASVALGKTAPAEHWSSLMASAHKRARAEAGAGIERTMANRARLGE